MVNTLGCPFHMLSSSEGTARQNTSAYTIGKDIQRFVLLYGIVMTQDTKESVSLSPVTQLAFASFLSLRHSPTQIIVVIYCYNMANQDQARGYYKRMHQLWQQRGIFECTEQQLCDQKKIKDKKLLTSAEIEEVKQQAEKDN